MKQLTLNLLRLNWPADWVEIFGRQAPLVVEIGFGNADFLVDLAQRRPETNVVGLEIANPSFGKAEKKVSRLQLENIRLLHDTGQAALWSLFKPATIAEIYLNFPDPWPKKRYHARRIINHRFLELLATRLFEGGRLDIATDHVEYAEWIWECLRWSTYFESRYDLPFVTEDDGRLRTKYEQKALAAGRTCYYFKWQRNDQPISNHFPVPEEYPMPHILLELGLNLEQVVNQFEKQHYQANGISVQFIDLFFSGSRKVLVVDTYIQEKPADQRVLLGLAERPDGTLKIHLHEVGFPRPTPGVHFAIYQLSEWLLSLNAQAEIISHNLRNAPENWLKLGDQVTKD